MTSDDSGLISYKDNYPLVTQYVNPIRSIDRFTVTIRDQDGNPIVPSVPPRTIF